MNTPAYFAIDNVSFSYTLGVEEKDLQVAAFPNPFVDVINIHGEGESIHLTDVNGNSVMKCQHNGLTQLNTSHLPSGIYFLEVTSSKGSMIRKLVK
jgi:hypothetical protein